MRTVILSREVQRDIDAATNRFRRLEDCIQALEWRLSHQPMDGVHRSGRFWIYRQKGIVTLDLPEISVLYSFTDDEVEFHAIHIRPAD
jgi:hypothetical protein